MKALQQLRKVLMSGYPKKFKPEELMQILGPTRVDATEAIKRHGFPWYVEYAGSRSDN